VAGTAARVMVRMAGEGVAVCLYLLPQSTQLLSDSRLHLLRKNQTQKLLKKDQSESLPRQEVKALKLVLHKLIIPKLSQVSIARGSTIRANQIREQNSVI